MTSSSQSVREALFGTSIDFLKHTLEKATESIETRSVKLADGATVILHELGLLEFVPSANDNNIKPTKLILSAGIHGNETAPIEIVSQQISQIVTGAIEPNVQVLYILGNPESMQISERFVSINMNRLFAGAFKNYEVNADNEYELKRAEQLESYVRDFYLKAPNNQRMHLDLHTAIKPSFHKTFAIRPHSDKSINNKSRQLLLAMGIEALLQHNKKSTTFSYFTAAEFDAEAYTLELGRVKAFGENNPKDFALAIECLDCLVKDNEIRQFNPADLIEYKVVAEIIKNSETFKFNVSDSVENFTAFPRGFLMAEDSDYQYKVAFDKEAIVFPNINVPVGQRVAVMVTQINSD